MPKLRDSIRRSLLVLIGCVMLLAASGAFAQTQPAARGGPTLGATNGGTGPGGAHKPTCDGCPGPKPTSGGNANLQGLVDSYKSSALQWTTQILNYATDLFWILAGIEFAWAAALLLLEQRELEGWVAAFLKKLMGISFFYALLLNAPTWINAIVDSFTTIGQNVGGTGGMTPDTILQQGVNLGVQVITSGANIGNAFLAALSGSFAYILLIGAIGCVIILCYVILTFTFVMALIEGYIVVSAGLILLGFGGSRWTQSYVERFLGGAVTSGVRMMVIFLMVGLSQSLATGSSQYSWTTLASAVGNAAGSGDYSGAAQQAFFLASSVIIFTALVLGLPKIVGGILNGSSGFGAGDMAGAMGAIGGGVAAAAGGASKLASVAAMAAKPYQMAAKAGGALAHAAGGGGGGAMSAMQAASGGSHAGSGVGSIGGAASHVPAPQSHQGPQGAMSNGQVAPPKSSSLQSASNASGGVGARSSSLQSASVGSANKNGAAHARASSNVGGVAPSSTSAVDPPAPVGDASPSASVGGVAPSSTSAVDPPAPVGDASPSASVGGVAPPSTSTGDASSSFASVGSESAGSATSGGVSAPSVSSGYASPTGASAGSASSGSVAPPASASDGRSKSEDGEKKESLAKKIARAGQSLHSSVKKVAGAGTSVQNWGSSMAQAMPSEIELAPPEFKDS